MLVIQRDQSYSKVYSFLGGGGPHPPFIIVDVLGFEKYTMNAIMMINI